MALLEVEGLVAAYGGVRALRGVSFSVAPGEMVAIVGANGAGKTTLLRAVSNMIAAQGVVRFRGQLTTGRAAHALARDGLLHVPEGRGTLQRMTVLENLRMAFDRAPDGRFADAAARAFARFPRLGERRAFMAGSLSGGEQQMLALSRAIVARPVLLLIDEPSLGLSPRMVTEAFATLRALRADGVPIVLVEQNARAALALADTGHVMASGRFVASGPAATLLDDPAMLAHYLGAAPLQETA